MTERTGAHIARELDRYFMVAPLSATDARFTCRRCGTVKHFDPTSGDLRPFHAWINKHMHLPADAN